MSKYLISAEDAANITANNLTEDALDTLEDVNQYIKERAEKGYTSGSIEVPRHIRDVICKELNKAGYRYSYSDYSPNIDIKW